MQQIADQKAIYNPVAALLVKALEALERFFSDGRSAISSAIDQLAGGLAETNGLLRFPLRTER